MFYSPLRYPGGKGKLSAFMKDIVMCNGLNDGTYVEPFAGGASIALSLLFEEYVKKIIINDIDYSIYAFWNSVLFSADDLCKLINDTDVTVEEWGRQKKIQACKADVSLLELGFSTFFLNRTNYSGIIKGGIIGGHHQNSKWKIDVRFNKKNLIKRIKKISGYASKIDLYNMDAIELINKIIVYLPKNTLVYFDPPYFKKGQDLYINFYEPDDHIKLYTAISSEKKHFWVLTYDNVNEIFDLYKNFKPVEYKLNYSAGNRVKGKELMFFSEKIFIPECELINPIDQKDRYMEKYSYDHL